MNMKECTYCQEKKDLSAFTKNNLTRDGYLNVCKSCNNIRAAKYREKGQGAAPTELSGWSGLKMNGTTIKDWCGMYLFLEKIGYDLEKNIHEQFCEKNNLKQKKRRRENVIHYSVQECKEYMKNNHGTWNKEN